MDGILVKLGHHLMSIIFLNKCHAVCCLVNFSGAMEENTLWRTELIVNLENIVVICDFQENFCLFQISFGVGS